MEHLKPTTDLLSDTEKETRNRLVLSYLTLRRLIGFTGMLLPVILIAGSFQELGWKSVQLSISDYYYTRNGDVLVGIICILSVFLFTYRGYDWKDVLLTRLAAFSGLGVALFPTAPDPPFAQYNIHLVLRSIPVIPYAGELHLIFAAVFFITLSCMSLFLFTRSDQPVPVLPRPDAPMTAKNKRNLLYILCGCIMLVCITVLAVYFNVPRFRTLCGSFPLALWLESIALEAFGISWLVKGKIRV